MTDPLIVTLSIGASYVSVNKMKNKRYNRCSPVCQVTHYYFSLVIMTNLLIVTLSISASHASPNKMKNKEKQVLTGLSSDSLLLVS